MLYYSTYSDGLLTMGHLTNKNLLNRYQLPTLKSNILKFVTSAGRHYMTRNVVSSDLPRKISIKGSKREI